LAVVAPDKTFTNFDYISLAWIVVSFIAMYSFKIGMITWIGVSAFAGLMYYLITTYMF
jgi:chromate transporter